MLEIDMDDKSWAVHADPAWLHRPSLFEMQLQEAVVLSYHVAAQRVRQTDMMHPIVTRAIAAMVPVDKVTNKELAHILFGGLGQDEKRMIRHFRNDERPLRSSRAAMYIQRLLKYKKITLSEGARLWYVVLLHTTSMEIVTECFRLNGPIDQPTFEQNRDDIAASANTRFDFILRTALNESSKFSLTGCSLKDIRQFMDYCAFVHWQESKVKRNPGVSSKRLMDLAPIFDACTFDE